MGEQHLSAFAVDADELLATAGSGDHRLVARLLRRIPALDRRGLLMRCDDPAHAETLLRELVDGRLDPARRSRWTDLLELLGHTLGRHLGADHLPGRGWDGLADGFHALGLPLTAAHWQRGWPFPFPDAAPDPELWPFPVLVRRDELPALSEELTHFATEPDWTGIPPEPEVRASLAGGNLPPWCAAALTDGRDLLLLRDGSR